MWEDFGGVSDCEELVGVTWRFSDSEKNEVGFTWRVSDCEELVGVTHRR